MAYDPDGKKYWIKPGIPVKLKRGPSDIIMTVMRIEKELHTIPDQRDRKQVLRGVLCSWIDAEGKPQSRLFRTDELIKVEQAA